MMGIPQESTKARPIKCRSVIYVLCSVKGQIIDILDSDYGRDWNIRLYNIVSPAFHQKGGKEQFPCLQRPGFPGEGDVRVLPVLLLRLDKSPHPE